LTARDVWRWTDERGVQRLVGTDELRAALSSGILPPTTLVWREGMKEWLPASSMPELASAAFAAPSDPTAPGDPTRRATLVGISTGTAAPAKNAKAPVEVPATGERVAVTQVPPFGAPGRGGLTPVPPAPRIPSAPTPGALALSTSSVDLPKPKRKITTSEVDSLWATTTNSDEDETIPRRARPSELAAAAAAAADASGGLREVRARMKLENEARKAASTPSASAPKPPVRRPPPLPAKARLDGAGAVAPKDNTPPRPPPRPPLRDRSPPPPAISGALPVKPIVRIKPPDARPEPEEAASAIELQETAAGAPVPGAPEAPKKVATLIGLPSPGYPAPAEPSPSREPSPPPPEPSPAPEAGKPVKTLVSSRDSAETVPGLAAAVAAFDAAAEDTIPAPVNGVARPPGPIEDNDSVTSPSRALMDASRAGMLSEPGTLHDGDSGGPPATEPLPHTSPTFGAPPDDGRPAPHRRDWGSTPLPPIAVVSPLGASPLPSPVRAGAAPAEPEGGAGGAPQPVATNGDAGPGPGWSPAAFSLPPSSGMASSEPESQPEPSMDYGGATSAPFSEVGLVPGAVAGRRGLDELVSVPVSSLLGAGGMLIAMVVAAFFVGRASSSGAPRLVARPSFGAIPARARAAIPPPPRPCWMAKQPAMWAAHASRSIPFEAVATKGGALAIGYARDAKEAMGIQVDLATGEVKKPFDDKGADEIERVMPTSGGEFRVVRVGALKLQSAVEVPAATPFAVGLANGAVALASPPAGAPVQLWPVAGEEGLGAAAIHATGDRGFALTFRRGGAVWGGFIGADRKARGELVKVTGSGGAVGKPSGAWNGREVAVVFADRPEGSSRYEIRIGHAPAGSIPTVTAVIPLPRGGPGGDAFAPDIAGLDDGRWVLMWTEGASGSRAVRAQTLAPDFRPLGDPIALSPPAGNFGQGVTGVVGGHVATVFLSKGSSSYELWGAVLQCGG
jgi:hypothetical protein